MTSTLFSVYVQMNQCYYTAWWFCLVMFSLIFVHLLRILAVTEVGMMWKSNCDQHNTSRAIFWSEMGQWGRGERDGGRKEQRWMRRGRGRRRGDTLEGWWAVVDSPLLWKVGCSWSYGLDESTSIKFFISPLRITVIQHLVAAVFRSQQDLAMTSWYVMSYDLSLTALTEDRCIA